MKLRKYWAMGGVPQRSTTGDFIAKNEQESRLFSHVYYAIQFMETATMPGTTKLIR